MRTQSQQKPSDPAHLIPLRDSIFGVGSLLVPAVGFVAAVTAVAGREGAPPRLAGLAELPWELWLIAVGGVAATICGVLDWRYHVTGRRLVGRRERHGELIALGLGGVPTFALMLFASVMEQPAPLLLPIVVVVLFTTAMICYDEFVFHRNRCTRYETALHRTLVFGNGLAWAAWMHWIFVRG